MNRSKTMYKKWELIYSTIFVDSAHITQEMKIRETETYQTSLYSFSFWHNDSSLDLQLCERETACSTWWNTRSPSRSLASQAFCSWTSLKQVQEQTRNKKWWKEVHRMLHDTSATGRRSSLTYGCTVEEWSGRVRRSLAIMTRRK